MTKLKSKSQIQDRTYYFFHCAGFAFNIVLFNINTRISHVPHFAVIVVVVMFATFTKLIKVKLIEISKYHIQFKIMKNHWFNSI